MKTKIAAVGAMMLTRGDPKRPFPPSAKAWIGDHCPITGKKYPGEDADNPMAGNTRLKFEHEGMRYEAYVWDESAVDEFESNRERYMKKFAGNSE